MAVISTSLSIGAVVVAVSLCATQAGAEPVGRVLMSVGEVVANRGGATVVLGTGINIESGDQIRTGPSSSVQIRLNDMSIIALKSQTIFSIDEFVYAGRSDGRERAFFNLIAGGMRTVTGLIGKANQRNYAVKTPTATVGIRGSGFNLTACTPAAPCTNNDGSRARDGTYGQVFDLAIFSQTSAGTQDWQKGDVFLIPDPHSLGERLREAPGFLAHTLVERSRNAGRSGGAEGPTAGTVQTVATDGRATQTPTPPAPLVFASTESRNASGGIAVVAATTVTGFIVNYTLPGGSFDTLSDCGSPPCTSGEITSAQFNGNQLIGYSTTTGPATLSAAGAAVTNLQTLDLGGSIIGIYRLTGPLGGVAAGGTPYSNPGAFLVGFTNDPGVGNGLALPASGNFLFGGPGNSIGLMADAAGNSAPISLSGSFNAVSRVASFSANGTFSNVTPGFGPASLSFGGGGTVLAGRNEVHAAPVSFSCTGTGCQTSSGTGLADIFFLRNASGLKAILANGGLFGATAPGNTVVFIGAGRCISGPC